ncbi:hypothetical protein SAMN04488048_11929 [Trichococcus flocculiformis]|uniref:Uncharacterized protein n=1 Tax=Trichococcus shcherbakoviae TaxID=2094020 RepID=A0A383TAF4_9LACT|nr:MULTISPECIES: hypothetical protein [Trichococcus]OUL08336.1 hypothetical protein B0533_09625 [Sedimentibacter sp. SX930]CZR07944.1 Hypothetical protein TES5_2484 [Trichococcus sp. ES5]SHF96844.1 hypothetical protein SAMN04488048_11929 [Trichococcus flocculiformis]SYZ77310.1 Hypothetical protein TART1_0078 [Trichococcus shcherbakoviae]
MTMTKEQFEHCERMEAAGGPKSQAEAMLYHQYKQQKAAIAEALKMGKENYQTELLAKVVEVHRLEEEIAKLQQHLYLERVQVDKMMELMDQF